MKIGCHISISGGIEKSPRRAAEAGCECFQIFTRSPRGGEAPKLHKSTVEKFVSDCGEVGISNFYVHTPYIINLASADTGIRKKSVNIIVEDLERSDSLGAACAVTHIGSSSGMKRKEAITKAALSLREILDRTGGLGTRLLIENSAGQGGSLCDQFEEIAEILDKANHDCLEVCLDTAHLFGAGYDIRSHEGFEETLRNINKTFSSERIRLLHCNDSKVDLGSRKDRHEHIGLGKIGKKGFKVLFSNLLRNCFGHADIIVETPPPQCAMDVKALKKIRHDCGWT